MASAPTLFKLQRLETRAGPVAIVTMDNGEDWQKPNTFGEQALRSLEEALGELETGEWRGLLLTGKPFVFAVGADMGEFGEITPERAREGGRAGHELFGRIRELPFVTVAAINGAALGGGVEIALHCDYRTIATSVRHFACPEVFLGLIPGWGGTQLVPRLVGAEQAVKFVVENPLRQNRMLTGPQAHETGFADALLEPVELLDESLAFLLEKIEEGAGKRHPQTDLSDVSEVCRKARARLDGQVHGAAPAPYRALDLIEGAASVVARGGVPGRGGRARRPAPRPPGPGVDLRLRARRAAREARSRDPRGRAASRPEARRRRRRADGPPAGAARGAAAGSAGRRPRPHAGAGRRRDRVDRGRAGRARAQGSPRRGEGALPRLARQRRHRVGRVRRLRPRPRGRVRGDGRQEGGLRRARARRLARVRARDEHVVAVRHRDGRRPRAPGARRRHALLQPGRGAAARRARQDAADGRRDARHDLGASRRSCARPGCSSATRRASS